MVTFRFYVVSTVAFFLALAVGVVVGSALDERLVEGLRDRIERVEDNLDETVSSIDEKNQQIDELERYVEASAPYAVQNALPEASVVIVAEEGVDADPVEDLVERFRQAGARADGIIWLQPKWDLEEESDAATLSELFPAAEDPRSGAISELVDSIAGDIQSAGTSTSTTTGPSVDTTVTTTSAPSSSVGGEPLDVFTSETLLALEQADFVRFQRIDGAGSGGGEERLLVTVTGTESDFGEPGLLAGDVAATAVAEEIPSVVAEVFVATEDGPDRGDTLARARDVAGLATVDDLDLIAGRVAVVLALASGGGEPVGGHYGYGPDTDGVLPEWPGP